ncbi:PREDICTED: homeobox-leucine zipper protein HDG8-like [Camelina sativa]|uniref:Homeobox-leucine zipper protein HDG8-like n=1 Tax=Camelina sativa TaxID=90675 RepID=A0ABM0V4Q7_CAMSA|nr:PREDICTED: homeobox-leucine zipper protein HDG8-like [Camelina sativa]
MENDGSGSSCNEQYASEDSKQNGKRTGHRHTPQQIQGLEAFFMECPHPDEAQRQQLCEELKLGPDQVKFWFQNKRTQCKAQEERADNLSLRGENEILENENEAMLGALISVLCPDCGGPPFGIEERKLNFQKLLLENARLKDQEKWKELFPTMVNKAKTLYVLGSELPIRENCNILRVMWEKLHILSPLVPPREFMIVRCCQEISKGVWIIADVSHNDFDFDFVNASCYKRPSGCLIQSMPNAQSKVMWIEHVEVAHKLDTHKIYRELLSGGSGYGAKRWIATLERMCERMALTSNLTLPASDWSEVIRTGEERRRVLKLGERMIMNFNEMLTMSGKVDFPQQSKCGVRVSMRMNLEAGQPPGLIVSAASSLRIPLPPVQVFDILRKLDTRQQWDVLAYGTVVTEIARIATGSSETNCLSILRVHPTQEENNNGKMIAQESDKDDMLMLQDCYMDALGGMLVYAPMDMATMDTTLSGADVKISDIPILPSGFIISSDGRRSTVEDGGTLLTLAFQILVSGKTSRSREVNERSVDRVSALISSTVQRIKGLLNCPDQF